MVRRIRTNPWGSAFAQRTLKALTRAAVRAGTKAMKQALAKPAPRVRPRVRKTASAPSIGTREAAPSGAPSAAEWRSGIVVAGTAGSRRFRLYQPAGIARGERVPLLVMLHGCGQDAGALAAATRMNRLAAKERFILLYPEQDRLANPQGCWNWFDTRSGRASREAASVEAAIDQVCARHPVDPHRVALAGLSAGANLAALLALRRPSRYGAVAMHSGVAPGAAHSAATALAAMRGRRSAVATLGALASGTRLPALLVIHGSADPVVAISNAVDVVRLWSQSAHATQRTTRRVQRGARRVAQITDHVDRRRVVATLCEVEGLGHAWSGGAAGQAYSDPKGPDASRMIWAFMRKRFDERAIEDGNAAAS